MNDKLSGPRALRNNSNKPRLAEVFWFRRGLEQLAIHMQAGRAKYRDLPCGTPNFMAGSLPGGELKPDSEYLDAAVRHLAKMVTGEKIDAETGTEHASAVVWNILALQTLNYESDAVPEVIDTVETRGAS